MLEKLEAMISIYLINFVLSGVSSYFFLWLGVKISQVKRPSLKITLLISFYASFIVHFGAALFSLIPTLNAITGFFIGIASCLVVLKFAFHTNINKAIILWIFFIVAQLLAIWAGAYIFIGGITDFIKII